MKNNAQTLMAMAFLLIILGCAPVIVSHRPAGPPPPWFYPNRVEVVRYTYFPELNIYYDLTAGTYIYMDGGIWVRQHVLPQRYRSMDLSRNRYERIRNFYGDDIRRYHEQNNANRGRSNKNLDRSRNR